MSVPTLKYADRDSYLRALDVVITHQRASVNIIQKKAKVGYLKAKEILWAFTEAGFVSEDRGSRRQVFATWETLEEIREDFRRADLEAEAEALAREAAWQAADQGQLVSAYRKPPAYKASMTYKDDLANEVFDRVAVGEQLSQILQEPHLPSYAAFTGWLEGVPCYNVPDSRNLTHRYAFARLARADALANEVLTIADDDSGDIRVEHLPGNVEVATTDRENVQRSKLRVDTRKWVLEQVHNEYFSDDSKPDTLGPVGEVHEVPALDVRTLTAASRDKLRAWLEQVEADRAAGLMPAVA